MLHRILFLFLLIMPVMGVAQVTYYPWLPDHGNTVDDFLPIDWEVLKEVEGDLNGDSLPDKVLVFQLRYNVHETITNQGDTFNLFTKPRMFTILLQQKDKPFKYKLSLQNNTFILREGEGFGRDPFQNIEILKDTVILKMQGGSVREWQMNYAFILSKNKWKIAKVKKVISIPTFHYNITNVFRFSGKKSKNTHLENTSNTVEIQFYDHRIKKKHFFKDMNRPGTWMILNNWVI